MGGIKYFTVKLIIFDFANNYVTGFVDSFVILVLIRLLLPVGQGRLYCSSGGICTGFFLCVRIF